MSIHYTAETLVQAGGARKATPFEVKVDRSFDLPPVLHAATVGLYFGFLAVMMFAFQDRGLILPMAINVIYVVMAFSVPALWTRMKPAHDGRSLSWSEFARDGVATNTGRMNAKDATGQVLILPVLILGWAVAIATIVAMVR